MFEEINALYFENNAKPINEITGKNESLKVKERGTYNYHSALKV
jgi:hypothetical protein